MRDVPLVDVLIMLDSRRDIRDPDRWDTRVGKISVKGHKFFCWSQGHGGGGAIDLVMHILGVDFLAAREWIMKSFLHLIPTSASSKRPIQSPQTPSSCTANLERAMRYLTQRRGLPQNILLPLINKGTLYADQRGNAVFVLLGKEKRVVGAELRGTGNTPFKGLFAGSQRTHGFFYAGPEDAKYCILCESAIDAISCQLLFPGWLSISTSGAWASPPYLPTLLRRDLRVFCGFDNDKVGNAVYQNMTKRYPKVMRLTPKLKDWNRDLNQK